MSNQLQITGAAKVRGLEGVLTGTSGVVGALGINVANGIPKLDSNGKILVSQLPSSVMEYKGTWNAATNTPTLANGTGDTGDVYLCNVAGTTNFGAGPITFAVGDQVIYSGSIWQKASGATGTVTSVAMTVPSGLTVTGSPITTAGTLAVSLSSGYTIPTTSFLAGLVPYTGATTNVNLGNYTLTTGNVWVTNSASNAQVNIQQTLTGNIINAGYTSIWTTGNNFYIAAGASSGGNSKSMYFDLSGLTNNTTRTFTLPDANGTLALTSNITVTSITGTSPISVAAVGTNYAISIQQASSGQNGFLSSTDWTTFNNKQGAITLTTTGSSGAATLIGNTLNIPNYGSALSGYLPLTGGTLTGGLYINPTNTGVTGLDVASNTTRFRSDNLEGFKRQLEITMGSGTLVQMVAKGFGANYGTDLAFYTATSSGTNASPAIYITGTNNRVGIKTGSPAYDLDVTGTGRFTGNVLLSNGSGNKIATLGGSPSANDAASLEFIPSSSAVNWAIRTNWNVSGALEFCRSSAGGGSSFNTPSMLITSTGNVGIGTSSPWGKFNVYAGTNLSFVVQDAGITDTIELTNYSSGGGVRNLALNASTLTFGTGTAGGGSVSERMRITSGGQTLIYNTASLYSNVRLSVKQTTGDATAEIWSSWAGDQSTTALYIVKFDNVNTTSQVFQRFVIGNGNFTAGQINANGANQAAFGSWSDIRLKENVENLPSQLDNIMALRPVEFDYKDGSGHQIGFIAQEMQEVYADAVGEDSEGFLTITGWSKTEARLVKTIQELNEIITKQGQAIEELKALINK